MNDPAGADFWQRLPPVWDGGSDGILICCQIREETHDVCSFVFRSAQPALFRFLPGQFVTLELDIDGETLNRCYTIASPPTRPDALAITVKRVAGGRVSNWLHDALRPGDTVRALGPAGAFSCALHPAAKYLFLSGGSGITPLMSMARSLHDLGGTHDVVFVHSARTPRDIVFRRELGLMAASRAGLRTVFVCEGLGAEPDWCGPLGLLGPDLLQRIAPDVAEREIFCCGPAPYMDAVRRMLPHAGGDLARYHEESFSFADTQADGTLLAEPQEAAACEGFRVEFVRSARTLICPPGQNLLDAARAAGLRLPSSCARGVCGTCKSRLLEGQVHMTHGGGIRQREIDQGLILPCCSTPLTDLVIER